MASRFIVVTAADETYSPLLQDWLRALRRVQPSVTFNIGILDLGLSEASKAQLAASNVILKSPKIDIDYPGREAWEAQAPFYRAMTARPYLRDYFPGYDAYMWMDADTWTQTSEALDTMLPFASADDAIYIASEFDRDYSPYFLSSQPWEFHLKWYRANFSEATINKFFPRPMFNTGVMALSSRSPVWKAWGDTFAQCLQSLPLLGRENFMSEQLSLNVALHLNGLPYKVMPAEFNWLSLYALPMIDAETGFYARPTPPRSIISVLHLTHQGKLRTLDLKTTTGQIVQRSLTFTDFEESRLNSPATTNPI